ncbi:gamma-taxilin-like isoform X2 [Limulus polyphemus]|uniref:Gamma-taxilin-like isoform X2 n=1 Tax=Limulus polyphemus TaxID=6850 RepID=A0ABM1C235_LIMPO|nr:gamma-taxilin-like isoform X2 [Limulus polyphemus]
MSTFVENNQDEDNNKTCMNTFNQTLSFDKPGDVNEFSSAAVRDTEHASDQEDVTSIKKLGDSSETSGISSKLPEDTEDTKLTTVENTNEDESKPEVELQSQKYAEGIELSATELKKTENDMSEFDTHSIDKIMFECSSAAQQIKDTICQVLKSRDEQPNQEGHYSKLEENIKVKISDLEQVIKRNSSDCDKTSTSSNSTRLSEVPPPCNISDSSDPVNKDQKTEKIEKKSVQSKSENKKEKNISKNESFKQILTADSLATNTTSSTSIPISGEKDIYICSREDSPSSLSDPSDDAQGQEKTQKQPTKTTSKTQKGESTIKRKGEKTVEHILKSLTSFSSTEEKLMALCKKQIEVLEDQRTLEVKLKQTERHVLQVTKEKEQLQAEHNRTVLAKSRLESLCRELQRQNKAVKEDSLSRIREEEEKRKEVAGKFQATLNDITNLMQDNQQRYSKQREENGELAQKLKSLVDHYEMWEKHMEKVVRQKELESQLAKAKLAKASIELKQERESYLNEKQQLLESVSELQKRCAELSSNELKLRSELVLYTNKYEEFQTMLAKSNKVFTSFKTDMDKMSKKVKNLEKETSQWKLKWENSNRALIDMASEKQKQDQQLIVAHQRILTLEKLCRALQTERNQLQSQLKNQTSDSPQLEKNNEHHECCVSCTPEKENPAISTQEVNLE